MSGERIEQSMPPDVRRFTTTTYVVIHVTDSLTGKVDGDSVLYPWHCASSTVTLDTVKGGEMTTQTHNERECWCGLNHDLERRIAEARVEYSRSGICSSSTDYGRAAGNVEVENTMSARNTHAKGNAFEREVADALESAGFTVRGLESGGDHLAITPTGRTIHVECKRQERLQLPIWLRQQERDCPPGLLRGLVFRQSRRPSYVVVPLDQWVRLLGGTT